MKHLFAAFAMLSLSCAAFACAGTAAVKTPQQNKMATCNAEAKGKTGDEHKAFMKACLSNPPAKVMTPQQERMKACNAEGKGKKGDEHKAFMKTCLSAK